MTWFVLVVTVDGWGGYSVPMQKKIEDVAKYGQYLCREVKKLGRDPRYHIWLVRGHEMTCVVKDAQVRDETA